MKGVLFNEFLDQVEDIHGAAMKERVVGACDLSSGGVYTNERAYPCEEMGQLIAAFARLSNKDPVPILHEFGRRLATTFHHSHPEHFEAPAFFDFVESLDALVHAEVKKRDPEAQLPRFSTISREDNRLVIDYVSSRGLEDLAYGLFRGCSEIFGEPVHIAASVDRDVPVFAVRFTLDI